MLRELWSRTQKVRHEALTLMIQPQLRRFLFRGLGVSRAELGPRAAARTPSCRRCSSRAACRAPAPGAAAASPGGAAAAAPGAAAAAAAHVFDPDDDARIRRAVDARLYEHLVASAGRAAAAGEARLGARVPAPPAAPLRARALSPTRGLSLARSAVPLSPPLQFVAFRTLRATHLDSVSLVLGCAREELPRRGL